MMQGRSENLLVNFKKMAVPEVIYHKKNSKAGCKLKSKKKNHLGLYRLFEWNFEFICAT